MEIGTCPTQREIKDMLKYVNGNLYWIKGRRDLINSKAGCFDKLNPHKPPRVQIKGKLYYLNRLIWVYFNGSILDTEVICCIDKNPHNCEIENLAKISEEDWYHIAKNPFHNISLHKLLKGEQ